jgi:hypothetical protein
MTQKTLQDLSVDDLKMHCVWEMIEDPSQSDPVVKPVILLPVTTLKNRLVGTQACLADGSRVWVILGNVSLTDQESTKHFLTLSVNHHGKWFDLARYHDVDRSRRDGHALAHFIGKEVKKVFPIRYDITKCVDGALKNLKGIVLLEPEERLSSDALIQLSLREE